VDDPVGSQLQDVLAALALALFSERTLQADLERLARLSCQLIPACASGSLALLIDGTPTTVAVSDHVAFELDVVQYEQDEGPCLAALGGRMVRVGLLAADERFPHFAVGAADQRVASVLSTPIHHDGDVVGTLNLYSREPGGFDQPAEDVARVITAEAATAIVRSGVYATAHDLRHRLQTSHDEAVQVAAAADVLVAVQDCSDAQARGLLEHASTTTGERLVDVARRILDSVVAADAPRIGSDPPPSDDTEGAADADVDRPRAAGD
jgi:GAF domain-containing protein